MGCMRYGGRPKAGAREFFILLWKTHRHGSVTILYKYLPMEHFVN